MDGNFSTFERAASSYWAEYLADARPCQFPRSTIETDRKQQVLSVNLESEQLQRLQTLSIEDETEMVGVLHAAWALVLHCYTGADDVCFGHYESTHAIQVSGAQGKRTGMSAARLRVDETATLTDLIDRAKQYYTRGLQYLDAMPADVARSLHSSEKRLFNTTVHLARFPSISVSAVDNSPVLDTKDLATVRLLTQL